LKLTYSEFNEKCDQIAKGLMALGINKGDHIAVWAYNVPEWVYLQFASAKIGAILVTVNTYYKFHELEYLLKQSDTTSLFLVDKFKGVNYLDILKTIIPNFYEYEPGKLNNDRLPYLKNLIFIGDKKLEGMFNFNDLFKLSSNITDDEFINRKQSLKSDDVINMQYTSGTTGFPKGVMLTHYNIINNAFYVGRNLGLTYRDKLCIPVPFFHCFGCVLSTLNCVVHGSTMVPIEIFDAEIVLKSIETEKCTALNGVPTMYIAEMQHPNFKKYDLSSLRTGIMAGSSCPIEIMVSTMSKMHLNEITICYGLTEAAPVLTQTQRNDPIQKRVETVGKPLPHIEVKIVDPKTGIEKLPNEPGELIARSYGVMKGYYKMPDQTEKCIKNEWLHTKDLAMIDNEGYYVILGRIDDMIIRGGENVYPREIEEFLFTNHKIKDVAVVGVPSTKYGEEVCAFIQLRNNEIATKEEFREFCLEGIAHYKIPKYIIFTDSFPLTASGKIKKKELRSIANKKLNLINENFKIKN
jgi:fatty-acyl-CoA synthase